MTATRVIDDHIELANIGTKTHAEIESHLQGISNYAFPSADGNADQLLKTSGAGVLSWIDQPAGFACGSLNACNLTDIGTRAHSSLTGIGTSDHHTKYTDAEAVAAADASDKFVERSIENVVTAPTTLKRETKGSILNLLSSHEGAFMASVGLWMVFEHLLKTYNQAYVATTFPSVRVKGTDVEKSIGGFVFMKTGGQNASYVMLGVSNASANFVYPITFYHDKISFNNNPLKDIKNHADATLSGTPKVIELLIGSTPYYFKVYPTKT